MTDQQPTTSRIPWWSPHPVSVAAAVVAGAVCYGSQASGRYGGSPYMQYGAPLVYRWVPRAGFSNPPRFDPLALMVDLLVCVIVVLVCSASVQVFANLMFGPRRLTLRWLMVLVALVALPMGVHASLGPKATTPIGLVFMLATVLVFGAPFALGLFGAVMALDAAAGYLSRDRRRPVDREDSPS
ncbi:hypothetical protein [Paludisphaera rhizosphaerae]|uniref:hypothetical protein n=1 Tax=Paludisphaera rhizosphaerae TaxID=2711216 RepID=UPI0013EA0070|nr:hypothetical protein [Paludisphaera rhizosphaerae]